MKVEVEQEKRWKGEGMCGFASGAILCEVFMLNMSSVDYYFVSFFSLLVSDWLVSNEYITQTFLPPQFCTLQTEDKTFYYSILYIVLM